MGKTGKRMDRRQMLTATGAAMIAADAMTGPAQAAWNKSKLEQAARLMDGWIADGRVRGASFAVKRLDADGMDLFVRNFGTAKGSAPIFLLASITKPMTAAAVMSLVDEGRLSLDDTVTKYFPAFTGDGRETITLRHLLTHTGGLPDMLADDEMLREHQAPLSAFRDGALKAPLKFKPGASYSYASMGILLAAEIAQTITGRPIADLAQERVFKPLGDGPHQLRPVRPAQRSDGGEPARSGHDRSGQEKLAGLELEQQLLAQSRRALGRGAGTGGRHREIP